MSAGTYPGGDGMLGREAAAVERVALKRYATLLEPGPVGGALRPASLRSPARAVEDLEVDRYWWARGCRYLVAGGGWVVGRGGRGGWTRAAVAARAGLRGSRGRGSATLAAERGLSGPLRLHVRLDWAE